MTMTAEEYLKDRVDDQLNWYRKKSAQNQTMYKRLQLLSIVFGATIPLLTAFSFREAELIFRFVIAFLGSAIAVSSGLLSLNKYQENWVKYRAAAQALKREKYLYLTKTGEYHDGQLETLVARCEAIMAEENVEWSKNVLPKGDVENSNEGVSRTPSVS
jgi:hypothetical protein